MTAVASSTCRPGRLTDRPLNCDAPRAKPLVRRVRFTAVLFGAWEAINRNAETSGSLASRQEVREFAHDLPKRLKSIQSRLVHGYRFAPQMPVLVAKGKGKSGKRGLLVATLEDRIVQRAILDVLLDATDLPVLQAVLATPNSIGGIRGRGVCSAIGLIDAHVQSGMRHVAGSDIANFFTKIPRRRVVDFIAAATREAEFVSLFADALAVELRNGAALSREEQRLFPTGADGVAQGCPLSALAGNIVLSDFDRAMNGTGVACVRYIDDFLLLGTEAGRVKRAMASADRMLRDLGMSIYDPETHPTKAFLGKIDEGHVFLGYRLLPGVYPPSPEACERFVARIASEFKTGKKAMRAAASGAPLVVRMPCCAQTLNAVDHIVRGWKGAFRATQCKETLAWLDSQIDLMIGQFLEAYRRLRENATPLDRRRALGVSLLQDRRSPLL